MAKQEPQTKEGLATVIAAVLGVYGTGRCRQSECKQAINHLIRAYGDLFCHKNPTARSTLAAKANGNTLVCKDHVVPVRELMKVLMDDAEKNTAVSAVRIQQFLDKNSITCLITQDEDSKLRKAGLWHSMPSRAVVMDWEFPNQWARYLDERVGIEWGIS